MKYRDATQTRGVRREGWVLLKVPRGDINGVGEDEVTVTLREAMVCIGKTAMRHTQAETHDRQTVLRRGGAPACARNSHSGAGSKLQIR